jgi:hypothetical protein
MGTVGSKSPFGEDSHVFVKLDGRLSGFFERSDLLKVGDERKSA